MGKPIRLDKLLASAGYGSRKDIKKMVREGGVTINGAVAKDSSAHVLPEQDIVTVNEVKVTYKEFIYLLMNKPQGYISATADPREQTVIDLVPEEYRHYDLFPVGRLDKDTEGLLILTNDGRLAHDLLTPKKHVPKTYFVRVEGDVRERQVKAFAQGVTLDDGYKTKPAVMKVLVSGPVSEVELTIVEGKFHQVKRMFKAVRMDVVFLKRVAMGGLILDPLLETGKIRELVGDELELLKTLG